MRKGRSKALYPEPDKLNGARTEAQTSNPSEDSDKTDRVSIKFESDRLWEQH